MSLFQGKDFAHVYMRYSLQNICLFPALFLLLSSVIHGQSDSVLAGVAGRIETEGMCNSGVEELAFWLTDVAGPRLTASTGGERGYDIAMKKLTEYGIESVRMDTVGIFDNGGWENKKVYAAMIRPYYVPFSVNPVAWTGSTKGRVTAGVVAVNIRDSSDVERYAGRLKGKIVLLVEEKVYASYARGRLQASPYTDAELEALTMEEPTPPPGRSVPVVDHAPSVEDIIAFIMAERAAVVLRLSKAGEYNVARSTGFPFKEGEPEPVPQLNLSLEAFGRLYRLLCRDIPVKMEVEIRNSFTKNPYVINVMGEISGNDPLLKEEVVLIGAHIDSWHGGTGAVDNAAGCITMMEAMRILRALDIKPRRTIRIALWGGEEQDLQGSRGYVGKYLADGPTKERKPGYKKFMVYFNSDHLTGRFRGIYLQGNEQARPVFEEWLKPFTDVGCSTLSIRNFWNTDHIPFDEAGLPAFTFIQDQGESGVAYHTNTDTYERLDMNALKQNAVIMASLAFRAAMREERMPGKRQVK